MLDRSGSSATAIVGPVNVNTTPQVVGIHGNAWDAAVVAPGGLSASVDLQYTPFVTAFGNADAATEIVLQVSQNDVDFYDSDGMAVLAPGDFSVHITTGARYVRLRSTAAATITATIAGKD